MDEFKSIAAWLKRGCEMRVADKACTSDATHIVVTPWGLKRDVCVDHAEELSRTHGFLVGPREAFCPTCLSKRPQGFGFYCWCGAGAEKRFEVDGRWFALCEAHKPPPVWSLWKRLLMKIAGVFKRKAKVSEEALLLATAKAHERARLEAKKG